MTRNLSQHPPPTPCKLVYRGTRQAGGLAAAGTSPDWPYWTPCEWFHGLPSCHLSDSKGRWLAQGRLWDLGEPLWGTRNRSTSNLTRSRCEGAPPVRVAFWVGTGWVGHRPPPPWRGVAPAPPSVVPGCGGGGPIRYRAALLRGGLATGRPRRGGGGTGAALWVAGSSAYIIVILVL